MQKTNASYNCLDRDIEAGVGDRTANLWEGEPGDSRKLTDADLHREVDWNKGPGKHLAGNNTRCDADEYYLTMTVLTMC